MKSVRDECKSRSLKNVDCALDLFDRMLHLHPLPSIDDFNHMLGAIARMKHYSVVVTLTNGIIRYRSRCLYIEYFDQLLLSFEPCRFWVLCLSNNVETWLSTKLYNSNHSCQGALSSREHCWSCKVGRRNGEERVEPNAITCGTILNGLCKIGRTDMTIGLLRKIEKRYFEPNVVFYNTIIDSLCKDRLISEALNLLSEIMGKGIQPDLVTYTCLIQGLCNFGQWKEATALLNKMGQRKVMPDVQTFNILVDTLCKEGMLIEAK